MRKFLYIFCFGFLFTTCDDGDIILVSLDFDDEFEQCGELVFYKINENTSETLSILFEDLTLEEILDVDDNFEYETTLPLGGTNVFNYRSYGRTPNNNFFCNDIPPSNLQIESDEVSIGGEVNIKTVLVEDDNDGIPSYLEDENLDGDNDPATNPTDTDGDEIPDYLDEDDDGDNVLTIDEIDTENLDGDNDPTTNPKNTDANSTMNPDMIPDYLDTDDDGDGVLTRDEENFIINNDPMDDKTDENFPLLSDYLNDQIATTVPATAFRSHEIRMLYTITVTIYNINLPSITQQTFNFGTLNDTNVTVDSRPGSPVFN
ncbi:hypothetical protein [Psychroserpens ponticola]|uniref:Uncharacterized protein n=1 Tax=Psychroserpens ponticola TaxID=2932268 RepID=A0ABY7S1H3_9FLAO|nr:hypothetical protein [Psychroserpens ponticola]WCO03019.1 hypothetical protein MUN68_005880 [Psychroserpens ponticola]